MENNKYNTLKQATTSFKRYVRRSSFVINDVGTRFFSLSHVIIANNPTAN